MSVPFQRTVVLNVSEFPSVATRVDIAKCVYAKFQSHFPIESIQFMPGSNVQVTFRSSAAKRSVESVESVAIGSVHCRVVRPGPRLENVLVFHYPFESSPSALRMALSSFGEVHEVSMQHYPDLNTVSTGTRVVRMVRKSSIPRSLDINGCVVKVWYRGQPVECDICGKSGHVSKVCPLKGKCRRCLQPGHLARNCKNAPRAWGTAPLSGDAVPSPVSSVASQDPTPAEAAAASVPVRPSVVPAASASASQDPIPAEVAADSVPVCPSVVPAASASSAPASCFAIGVYGADENWGMGDGEMDDGDASSASDEGSVGAGVGETDVNGDGVVDGDLEASQSILSELPRVVDPASADVNVSVGVDSQVQCLSSVESLPDGQVVNTPLSGSQNDSSSSVATVLKESDVRPPARMRWVPEQPYRNCTVLRADGPTQKFLVRDGNGKTLWIKAVQEWYRPSK